MDGITLSITDPRPVLAPSALEEQVRAAAGKVPVVCGTGCRRETVAQILQNCDGAFVGTTFKKDGVFENRVDARRVKEFMDTVKQMRGNA